MSQNKIAPVSVAAAVALLLASPALAKCAQPTGVYVGGGAGPVTLAGSAPVGGQVESWYLQLPTKKVAGRLTLEVQSPPQPGDQTSAFGFYAAKDLAILPEGTAAAAGGFPIVWDEDNCKGLLTLNFNPLVTWVDQSGNKKTQSYVGGATKTYEFTITDNNAALLLSWDRDSLAAQFRPSPSAFPPFVPGYKIRLEKQ
jgi:hypothetical protein